MGEPGNLLVTLNDRNIRVTFDWTLHTEIVLMVSTSFILVKKHTSQGCGVAWWGV